MLMLQPRAQPGQTDVVSLRNQTRILKRKSLLVRAPTGQTSTVFPAYGLSSFLPGKVAICAVSPRSKMPNSLVFEISLQKRDRKVHKIQRSESKTTSGPN